MLSFFQFKKRWVPRTGTAVAARDKMTGDGTNPWRVEAQGSRAAHLLCARLASGCLCLDLRWTACSAVAGGEDSEPSCPPWEREPANRELSLNKKREPSGGWDDPEKLAPLAWG